MKKCIKALFVLVIFCHIVSCNSFAEATSKDDKFTLEVKDQLISLQAENANFKEILREIEGKTGIKVKIFEGIKDKDVSLNIKSLPVYAVGTILEKMSLKNFAVVYDDELASVAIYILPEGKDISKVTKCKSIIRHANFASGKIIDTIKDRRIVSITRGENKTPIRYVKDEVLLKFHLGVSKQEIREILKKHNLVEVSDGTLSKIGYIKVRIPDGSSSYYEERDLNNEFYSTVVDIAIHPTDSDIIWALDFNDVLGEYAGILYLSTDGGDNWSWDVAMGAYMGEAGLVVKPDEPNVVFIGTFWEIVRVEYDENNWGNTPTLYYPIGWGSGKNVRALAFDPQNANILYAALGLTENFQLLKSTDGGINFNYVYKY